MDSLTGDDSNTGNSPSTAWKSLKKLNEQMFEPGDRILFKSGTEYIGQFEPKGSGSKELSVVMKKAKSPFYMVTGSSNTQCCLKVSNIGRLIIWR